MQYLAKGNKITGEEFGIISCEIWQISKDKVFILIMEKTEPSDYMSNENRH